VLPTLKSAIRLSIVRNEEIGTIRVEECFFRRILDEDINDTVCHLEELLDFLHGASVDDLIAVNGEVDSFVIDTRDMSREECDDAAEMRVSDGGEVRLASHEAALDKNLAVLELLSIRGESADGEETEERRERARSCVLHCRHALLAWSAWWYFDSTSFPYPSLWRFSLSIFSIKKKTRVVLFFYFLCDFSCLFINLECP
jgi:hypothetical protein